MLQVRQPIYNLRAAPGAGLVGGKAANLGRLIRGGFNVPSGFVISTASRPSRATTGAILEAYAKLGRGPVAVRSSATNEDGVSASFAGLYETILNVEGEYDLVKAIDKVRNSRHNEAVEAYLEALDLPAAPRMGVIVQRMLSPDYSGVMFTCDPLSGERDVITIEAVRGLADVLVGGRVTPSLFVVNESGKVLLQDDTQNLDSLLRYPDDLNSPLARIAALGRKIEIIFGQAPQDIEWAVENDLIYILQARPVTGVDAPLEEIVEREVGSGSSSKMELITQSGIAGYYLEDIQDYLTPERWVEFCRWYRGQTGALINGKALVYQWDWDGWVRGWDSGLGEWD